MSDYISREAAMSMPLANGQYDHEHSNEHFIFGLETYKEWLERIPAADVRHVVYCRECRYWNRDHVSCEGLARCLTGETGVRFRNEMDFCSRGAKMGGADE